MASDIRSDAGAERTPVERGVPVASAAAADGPIRFSGIAAAHLVPSVALDRLLERLPVGVLMVDRDGTVVYANEAARALRIEHVETLAWAVTRALLTEDEVREDEIEVTNPGEPRRWLSARILPVRAAGLGVNAAFVVLADVTARTRLRSLDPVIESLVNL